MNILGIGLSREGLSLAVIDLAGAPLALPIGDSDALQRQLLALRQDDTPIFGVAALNSVLKRPGAPLRQIECSDQDGAARLLEEALAECRAVARTAASQAHAWVVAINDGAYSAEQLWDAASRVPLTLSAAISRNAAMANYLGWWVPSSLGRCRVLDLDVQGTLRRGELTRRAEGCADYTEEPGAPLDGVHVLLDSLGKSLEAQLGSAASDAPAICARICEQLLLECLASTSPSSVFGSCMRSVRGKEITFTLAEADINRLLHTLADLVRVDSPSGGSDLPAILLCPLLGDEMRVRLLDLTLAQTLMMPRNALAALAYGAALNPNGHSIGVDMHAELPSTLGVFAGDRRDPHQQRFLPLIDGGTALPTAASRTFFSRGGTDRMVFELAMGGAPEEPSLARIIVPIPPANGIFEVQLDLRVTVAGECSYSVSDAAGQVLASGFAGRIVTSNASHGAEQ